MPTTDNLLPDNRNPSLDHPRFNCPHCDAFAHQSWADLVATDDEDGWTPLEIRTVAATFDDDFPSTRQESRWRCAECASCNQWSFWHDDSMVYPNGRVGSPPHPDMPLEVSELYSEAAAVARVSRRAGAAMARAAVERLIKSIDPDTPKRATLEIRISRLKSKVSTPLGQLLDVVRVTGNGALHLDDTPGELVILALDDREGPAILALLLATANDLVEELITRPRTAAELWNKLPQSVRDRSTPSAQTSSGET